MLQGFKAFILRGNVVDLAVAVVIGAAFTAVVTAFVADILTPLIAAIFGKPDFSSLYFTVNGSRFLYGSFINAVISFLLIAAALYFFVVAPLNAMAERRQRRVAQGQSDLEPKPEDVQLLEQIRDLLSAQQGGGTARTDAPPVTR